MATNYYMQVHIESAGTGYIGQGIPKSIAGHMWYEIYQKDDNDSIVSKKNRKYNTK